jgi:hypothetical protein
MSRTMSKIHKELTSGEGAQWLMRTEGGDVYGPVDLETLQRWATQGRIEPESEISQDEEKWIAAEALAALHMDWVAEMADGTEYGPFNINLAPDLIKNGVLPADATLKHRETGEEQSIQQLSDDQQTALPLGDLMADAPKPKPKRRAPKEKAKASTSRRNQRRPKLWRPPKSLHPNPRLLRRCPLPRICLMHPHPSLPLKNRLTLLARIARHL